MNNLDQNTVSLILLVISIIAIAISIIATLVTGVIAARSSLQIKRFEAKLQVRKERATERLTFYIPFLRLCSALDRRLGRLLLRLNTDWLNSAHLEKINKGEGFATDQKETGYFFISSIYLFACFLGWAEAEKKRIDALKPFLERKGG